MVRSSRSLIRSILLNEFITCVVALYKYNTFETRSLIFSSLIHMCVCPLLDVVCNDACLQSELRRCTGLSPFLCCNVYDHDHCAVQCPSNKQPDHNFDCQCMNNFTGEDCKSKQFAIDSLISVYVLIPNLHC